jgi:hypothetical protein
VSARELVGRSASNHEACVRMRRPEDQTTRAACAP